MIDPVEENAAIMASMERELNRRLKEQAVIEAARFLAQCHFRYRYLEWETKLALDKLKSTLEAIDSEEAR